MLSSSCYVALFLALAFAFCNASTHHAKLQDNQSMNGSENYQVKIALIVELDSKAKWMHFNCNSGGSFDVGPYKLYTWYVPSDQVETCHASWGDLVATFDAYSTQDEGRTLINFLLGNPIGFFHSYDGHTWDQQRALWKHLGLN